MKTYALLLAGIISIASAATQPATPHEPFTAKELAQGFRDHVVLAKPRAQHRATADAAEAREGLRLARKFERFGDLRVLEFDGTEEVARTIDRLRATGRYEYVEPDYLRYVSVVPQDPDFDKLWGLRNTGQARGTAGADIKAADAWDIRREAPNVIVAVIDTGVNMSHTDLAPNLWTNPAPTFGDLHGARFTNGNGRNPTGDPTDDQGHGTHVAGTIGAVGNNGIGIAGVAWKVQIMALKYLTASGSGANSDGVACIDYAIAHGAQIINASYGANGGSPISQAEFDAINRARSAGIIFVAAAGNDTANMDVSRHYPASYQLDNIVTVGASTREDDLAIFSNHGAAVDLFAPGNDILSLNYDAPNGGTKLLSGTSMAAPHVSGALALLKAQFPGDNYRQLINRLLRGVDIGGKFNNQAQTNGRLNLLKALNAATSRPFNDDFADRPQLSGDNLAIRSNNTGATAEPGEPAHAGAAPAATLWWQWTAPGSSTVTVTTTSSSYDTVLAVYAGNTLGALTPVAENDNDGANATSSVTFTAQAGATYQIAVDGKNGATGTTFLTLNAAPSNDNFATPVVLSGPSARVTATNTLCTREPDEPRILNNAGGNSLWYRWTAPKSARFQVSAFTVDFDPIVAVYTGSALNALTLVAANDNTGFDNSQRPSLCTFDAIAGTTYMITMDAKATGGATTGEFTLSLVDSLWQVATGRAAALGDAITGSPTVAPDGTIYFGVSSTTDRSVYAINPDGSLKWTFAVNGSIDTASPAIGSDGTIYVGTGAGRFYAIAPSGTQIWTHDFGTTATASNTPAIAADGTIYVKIGDGKLYALEPASGATKWSFDVNGKETYCTPVIGIDGTIYQGSDDKNLYAINPNGTEKWRFATDATGDVYSTPAIDPAGNLYFGVLNSGKFYSITSAGTLRWVYTESFESISSSPSLSADGATVYFGSYDRRLHALNTTTGAARWTCALAGQVRASSPAIDGNGVVYIGCNDFRMYAVNPDGTLLRSYDTGGVVRSSPTIFGDRLYVGSADHKLYAFATPAGSAGGFWPQYRRNARHTGRAAVEAFAIVTPPQSQVAVLGLSLTLKVEATGPGPLRYEWKKDNVVIPGATTATYSVPNVTAATAGGYTVTVSNPEGSITSAPAIVTIETINPGRLTNLSVRTTAGTAAQTLTVGFVLAGSPDKMMLIRGIGPSLAQFGVTGVLADPRLDIFAGSTPLTSNDNWFIQASGTGEAVAGAAAAVGAFPLDAATRDAAILRALSAGSYSAQVTSTGPAGIALAELYDTSASSGARLINVSARAQVGTGGGILIAGFSISGNVPKQVLIRAVGPTLSGLGVTGVLANPRLDVFRGSELIQSNDDWAGTAALANAFSQVGAFSFTNAASRDAALVATLPPGSYTAQVSGVGNTTGVALVEIYEVP